MSGDLKSDEYDEKEGKNTMKYSEKTKKELIQLLKSLQKQISELKSSQAKHKRTEEALRASEKKYTSLFNESRDAIYITSKDGIIIDANPALLGLFGYSKEEMIGENVQKTYVNIQDREKFKQKIALNGFTTGFEVKLSKKDGTAIICFLSSIPRMDEKGNIIGYQGIIRDITERKQAEERIKIEIERRRHVVINTTHLIHTPLTIIKGNVEMVKMGLKEMTPELIDLILERAEEMESLVTGELYDKIDKMTVKTSDGFTPADDVEN